MLNSPRAVYQLQYIKSRIWCFITTDACTAWVNYLVTTRLDYGDCLLFNPSWTGFKDNKIMLRLRVVSHGVYIVRVSHSSKVHHFSICVMRAHYTFLKSDIEYWNFILINIYIFKSHTVPSASTNHYIS